MKATTILAITISTVMNVAFASSANHHDASVGIASAATAEHVSHNAIVQRKKRGINAVKRTIGSTNNKLEDEISLDNIVNDILTVADDQAGKDLLTKRGGLPLVDSLLGGLTGGLGGGGSSSSSGKYDTYEAEAYESPSNSEVYAKDTYKDAYRDSYNAKSKDAYRDSYNSKDRDAYRDSYNSKDRDAYRDSYNNKDREAYRDSYNNKDSANYNREVYKKSHTAEGKVTPASVPETEKQVDDSDALEKGGNGGLLLGSIPLLG